MKQNYRDIKECNYDNQPRSQGLFPGSRKKAREKALGTRLYNKPTSDVQVQIYYNPRPVNYNRRQSNKINQILIYSPLNFEDWFARSLRGL